MAFFGFDTSGHNTGAAGFAQPLDPFAGLSDLDNSGEALEFEAYDGLGDQLDETGDAFNDDTFGGGTTTGGVGKDFDFFGQTAKVADAIEEEHVRFSRQKPPPKAAPAPVPAPITTPSYGYIQQQRQAPVRTGYEKYKEEPFDDLQVDASLWGVAPKKQATPVSAGHPPSSAPSRKILSLEEVEAQMRAQAKKPAQPAAQPPVQQTIPAPIPQQQQPAQFDAGFRFPPEPIQQHAPQAEAPPPEDMHHHGHGHPVTILQRPHSKPTPPSQPAMPPPSQPAPPQHRQQLSGPAQQVHILQNPNRLSADGGIRGGMNPQQSQLLQQFHAPQPGHRQQGSFSRQGQMAVHPSQMAQLSEKDKADILEAEARRAKRNHKIYLMSRDNGIMTPSDKNFVTRIQLQQLVAATGNPNEHGTDENLAEDFYYQVHTQIQGGQRQHPSQPLNNFAQTYLFQTGNRHGGMRRHHRGPENHMQRMEQQVQRAVEAAKNKPKNKQLVIEGSLGKISFSNAKTPKPLLNIKRNEGAGEAHRPSSATKAVHAINGRDKKKELRSIELIFDALMKMEDHERSRPPPPSTEMDQEAMQAISEWEKETAELNGKLWAALRVYDSPTMGLHPFITLLSYNKGKKAIPRVFRQITHEQRTTILTLIAVNLDNLNVVRNAQVNTNDTALNAAIREEIDIFSIMVISPLLAFMNELDLALIGGILTIICSRDVETIAKSRVGAEILAMILSRAEILKHQPGVTEQALQNWENHYMTLFNFIEHCLPHIFPGSVNTGDDVYVWQLLAALGIHASPDLQPRLVVAVKDRVMETVAHARTLPAEMSRARLANVNLFMRSIGLDVELLQ